MPQFDFYCFSVQVFWTLSTFIIFYFYCLNTILTNLSELFKIRSKILVATTFRREILKFYSSCFY